MFPTIHVRSNGNAAVTPPREVAATRVISEYGKTLPPARLLCFFDDVDFPAFKQGDATRGMYSPVNTYLWDNSPEYVREVLAEVKPSGLRVNAFDHLIYLHGSTCDDLRALTMTFAHELHHFRQRMNTPPLWAASSLIPCLHKSTLKVLGWKDWADVPHERDARIVAKRIANSILGTDVLKEYIAERIIGAKDETDKRDWEFISKIPSLEQYDLLAGTHRAFQRLKGHRTEIEDLLREKIAVDATFQTVDLDYLMAD